MADKEFQRWLGWFTGGSGIFFGAFGAATSDNPWTYVGASGAALVILAAVFAVRSYYVHNREDSGK